MILLTLAKMKTNFRSRTGRKREEKGPFLFFMAICYNIGKRFERKLIYGSDQ